jgi:hypothetical protein
LVSRPDPKNRPPHSATRREYDLAGRRTKLIYPGSGLYVNSDYLVTGEASAIRENGATSGVGVLAAYSYDSLGNRTLVTFGNGVSQATTFDAVSRLEVFPTKRSWTPASAGEQEETKALKDPLHHPSPRLRMVPLPVPARNW